MRPDLKDTLVNTHRVMGWPMRHHKWYREDPAYWDADHEPMWVRVHGRGKIPGDRLNPLRRVLRANVGRPWTRVWSEICEKADHRSVRGHHLRQHVKWMVEEHPHLREDGVYCYPYSWRGTGNQIPLSRIFYVDQHGILRWAEAPPRHRGPYPWQKPGQTVTVEGVEYEKIDGCWYAYHRESVQSPTAHPIHENRWVVHGVPDLQGVRYHSRWEAWGALKAKIPHGVYCFGVAPHHPGVYIQEVKVVVGYWRMTKRQVSAKTVKRLELEKKIA